MSDAETTPAATLKPWGILATMAWALLATGLSIPISIPVLIWWHGGIWDRSAEVASDGVMFAALTCLTTPVQVTNTSQASSGPVDSSTPCTRWRPITCATPTPCITLMPSPWR